MLITWGNRGPAIVYRVDGKRRGPTSVRVGYVLPLWRSAAGRVFLAYLPERDTAALLREEEGARVKTTELAEEVARIRSAGFAITGDGDEFSGIAAPVLDHDGHLVAALTLSRPYDENTRERRLELGQVVRVAAESISKQLGHEGLVPRTGKNNRAKPDLVIVNSSESRADAGRLEGL